MRTGSLVPYVLRARAHLENMSYGGRVYRGDLSASVPQASFAACSHDAWPRLQVQMPRAVSDADGGWRSTTPAGSSINAQACHGGRCIRTPVRHARAAGALGKMRPNPSPAIESCRKAALGGHVERMPMRGSHVRKLKSTWAGCIDMQAIVSAIAYLIPFERLGPSGLFESRATTGRRMFAR
jgi:hypothetical protein